jgi:hypothetical protein
MYYPQSQITPNLYTNGGEFVYSTNKAYYSGYYFKTSTGQYFTGKNQNDTPNVELVPIQTFQNIPIPDTSGVQYNLSATSNLFEVNNEIYLNINSIEPTTVIVPTYYPTLPTQQDYQIGEFRRYFCKKTNEIQYIEISKDQFDLLVAKDPQILWQLYFPFFIPWDITGNKEQVARVNKNIVDLTMKNLRLPRFNDYIKNDYIKYYK